MVSNNLQNFPVIAVLLSASTGFEGLDIEDVFAIL
jgi:ERCC4-related helicase